MSEHIFMNIFLNFIYCILTNCYYYILDVQKKKGLKKTLEDHAGANISEQ